MRGFAGAFQEFTEADWRQAALTSLKGGALDALTSKTADGLPLLPLYAGRPGPRAARGDTGPWRAIARLDHPGTDDFAAQAVEDLSAGADGLRVVFAGATGGYGYGLAKSDSASLHRAFESVGFDEGAAFELDLGPDAEAQARAFARLVKQKGANPDRTQISFGIDPLGLRARSGRASRAWSEDARTLAALVSELSGQGFAGPFLGADGRIVHGAGGTPAQELAFALASAVAYLRALDENGLALESARDAIAFRLAADADQFATLSKFRAMRLLWARVLESSGLGLAPARIEAESAWRMMSARDPFVNVMRAALAAFAAGLGGADSVTLLPFSQAVGLPDAFARRLARNTQLIELRESHLGFVADPAAGAGVFEEMTLRLCETAWTHFQSWEAMGGLARALANGEPQKAIAEAAKALSRDVRRLKTPLTGVSAHADPHEDKIETLPAQASAPVFAGEPFAAPLAPSRTAEPFERLRDAADALRTEGAAPRLYLAAMGPISAHTRRVGFARDLFEAGGVETIAGEGASSAEEIVAGFKESGAKLACLCGADDAYREHATSFAVALKQAGASRLWLAGRPGDHESAWRAAGIDEFVFMGGDAVATLEALLRHAGAPA